MGYHICDRVEGRNQPSMPHNSYIIMTLFWFWLRGKCRLPRTSLLPNSVTSQNGIGKHLIRHYCYVLVGRGCDHTPIGHNKYVI